MPQSDELTDAQWLRENAEGLVRYEEDAQRLRKIADRLTAPIDGEVDRITEKIADKFEFLPMPYPDMTYWREIVSEVLALNRDRLS